MGYYRNFGVTAHDRTDAETLIARLIDDGQPDWNESDFYPVNFWKLEDVIRKRSSDPEVRGVWYVSGRTFHGPDLGLKHPVGIDR